MILIEDILNLHLQSIKLYGGGEGVRDAGGLEAAIARPFQTFDGKYLYPTIFEKAAALGESIIMNHPFVDGNKRTGFLAITTMLRNENFILSCTSEAAYDFTIQISTGTLQFDAIVAWLINNTEIY